MYQRAAIKLPRIPNNLLAETKDEFNSERHQLVGQKKEQCCNECHRHDQRGRDHGFTTAGPRHLGRFGPYLLQEGERVCF